MPAHLAPLPGILLLLLQPGCDDSGASQLRLEAVDGEGGVAIFLNGPPPAGSTLLRVESEQSVAAGTGQVMVDSGAPAGSCYRLEQDGRILAEACAQAVQLQASSDPAPALLLSGEDLTAWLQLDVEGLDLLRGEIVLRRLRQDTASYLAPECLEGEAIDEDCWSSEPVALLPTLAPAGLAAPLEVELPPYTPAPDGSLVEELGLYLRVQDSDGAELLVGGALQVLVVDAALKWGDLHAHSNLSMDGCEDVDAGCAPRGELPAEDFFDKAVEAGLDFAAITDHGEWDLIKFSDQPTLDIWEETQARVAEAQELEADGFIPLLGYEWTNAVDGGELLQEGENPADYPEVFVAGHRSVLFQQATACKRYRIASQTRMDVFIKSQSHIEYHKGEEHYEATSLEELHAELEQASLECGETELLSWYHHPVYLSPNPVSWGIESNLELSHQERLVEILSEHGSSECRDFSQEGCSFLANTDSEGNAYIGWGSVQAALSLGYRLGFVGGTDGHDGRPGSLDDGPSHVCQRKAPDDGSEDPDPKQLFCPGALTGLFVSGSFDRSSLFEALQARHTLASTWRAERVVMAAISAEDLLYLPGDLVPVEGFPLQLTVIVEPGDGTDLEWIEVVDPDDGAVLASCAESPLQVELEDPGGPALYVRVRSWEGEREHRLWLSPLFIER